MASSVAAEFWQCIEKLESTDQIRLLSKRLLCDREPIRKFADIKLGDQLVRKGSTAGMIQYEHHFLCIAIEVEEGERKPKIVHYYNAPSNAILQKISTSCFYLGHS